MRHGIEKVEDLAPLRPESLPSNPALAALGLISYSAHRLRLPLLWFSLTHLRRSEPGGLAGWNVTTTSTVCLLFIACVALSTLTYRLVERPFLLLDARLDA
jgi:peptidoglycan/LPS O-acetylase OafA/YrhL